MEEAPINGDQREKLVNAGKMNFVHWLIVAISVALTFTAWHFTKSQLNQKLELKFQRYAEQAIDLVKERMGLYENALWGGVAYIDATNTDITHTDWLTYANSLKIDTTYPGINGIGIIYNVQANQFNSYMEKQRDLRPNYKVHPSHNESEYWPITYIEPVEHNKKAVGLDIAFEINRYSSIKKARDSGKAQLTGPIILVQDDKQTPGFLFYTPFYKNGQKPETTAARRDTIVGVVYAPFIMKKLMLGTLAKQNRHVSIRISDNDSLLFDDNTYGTSNDYDPNPLFSKKVDTYLYGRVWTFDIQSNIDFREESNADQSFFILIGGLTVDAFLLGVFIFLTRANRKALAYADKMTTVLQDKTQDLVKSNRDLEKFSYVASHDLKSPLNSIKQLAHWINEDCGEILPKESQKHLNMLILRCDRMMKLLTDLLDYSRINRTEFKKERVNLYDMNQDIISLVDIPLGFTCTAPDVEINIPASPLEIVLRNLISNAIKHHDKDSGKISILYNSNSDSHIISVEDDGPGIPAEFHDQVMLMFQTLKPRDKVEGSGMGLAMVKQIVEHYGGNISIVSDGKHGTKFVIKWKK
ncbi:CHASE domain-containing protein [Colwellia sp. RE-S-Sl-9]